MHADFAAIEQALAALEHDLAAALAHHHNGGSDPRPARIDLTIR